MENKTIAQIWIQWLAIPITSVLLSYLIWIWSDDHRYFGFTAAWKIFFAFPLIFFVVYGLCVLLLRLEFGVVSLRVLNFGSLFCAGLILLYIGYLVVVLQTATYWKDIYDLAGDYTGSATLLYKPILGKLGAVGLIFSFLTIVLGIKKNKLSQCVIGFIFILLLIGLLFYADEFPRARFIDGSI